MIQSCHNLITAGVLLPLWLARLCGGGHAAEVLVEVEQFAEHGGWAPSHHPGRFGVLVAGVELPVTFGEKGTGWYPM